jgi:hypothetical protein
MTQPDLEKILRDTLAKFNSETAKELQATRPGARVQP